MISMRGFVSRYGWLSLMRLAVYPITVLVTTPIRLVQTLWASRVLINGRWGNYPHFSAHTALNSLFYWTRALSLYRFGRTGRAPYLGLGDARLSRFFFYSLPSLYAYWIAGAPTVLLGMLGWWLSHLIWLRSTEGYAVGIIMGLALISTMFYGNLALQNYNVIGWMFFPIGLYGLITGNWAMAGLAWSGASFSGVTIVVLAGMLSVVATILHKSFLPILVLLPAFALLASRFWPLFLHGNLYKVLLDVAKAVGVNERKAKYRRAGSKSLNLHVIYLLLLYIQFLFITFLLTRNIPFFFLSGILIFLINSILLRFADMQSMYMLMFSLATCTVILEFQPWLLPSYWLLVSPLPRFFEFLTEERILDIVSPLSPFDIQPFLEGMQEFLTPVQKGQRVLMAFEDPYGNYENIFDGYRELLELPLYVSAVKEIHFMPDWWGVFELNYDNAPEFWGRDVVSVQKNVMDWKADYVVVYQNKGLELAPEWQQAGFEQKCKFSWSDYAGQLRNYRLVRNLPDWWLLQVPKNMMKQTRNQTLGSATIINRSSE